MVPLQPSSKDHEVIKGVVVTVLIGGVLTELHESVGVLGKKYISLPLCPSIPRSVGDEGVRRPVCF